VTETVHIAGMAIDIGGRYLRQRCSWCGAVLIDYDLSMTASVVVGGEEPARPATWEVGSLVLVDGAMSTTVDGEKLPPASCVTRELDAYECAMMETEMDR
jgi:hypothetical protein